VAVIESLLFSVPLKLLLILLEWNLREDEVEETDPVGEPLRSDRRELLVERPIVTLLV